MLERVHEHILAELGHSARIDTIVVVVAIFFDLLALGINSGVVSSNPTLGEDLILAAFVLMTILFNAILLAGLLLGRNTRRKLLSGLLTMYADNDVDKYYDESLLSNYSSRYLVFGAVIIVLMAISIMVPLLLRFL